MIDTRRGLSGRVHRFLLLIIACLCSTASDYSCFRTNYPTPICGTLEEMLRIAIIGDTRVGKSVLVDQFTGITTTISQQYPPSATIFYADRIFEVLCIEVPSRVRRFPRDSLDEWDLCSGSSMGTIRNADAYLLVFDVSRPATFTSIESIYCQLLIAIARTHAPVVSVCANKCDLAPTTYRSLPYSAIVAKKWTISSSCGGSGAKSTTTTSHVDYIECSAKYNWNVSTVFRVTIANVMRTGGGAPIDHQPISSINDDSDLNQNRKSGCSIH